MPNCITNSDYENAADKQADAIRDQASKDVKIQIAILAARLYVSAKITSMIEDIAKRRLALAEAVHEHAKKFWPYEKNLVDDVFALQEQDPNYQANRGQWTYFTASSLEKAKDAFEKGLARQCLSQSTCGRVRWAREKARFKADTTSYAYRRSEARAEALNDQRYSKQYAALGLGRGLLGVVESYQNLAGATGLSSAHMIVDSINSGLTAYGYYRTRNAGDHWGAGATQQALVGSGNQHQNNVGPTEIRVRQIASNIANTLSYMPEKENNNAS